MSPETELELVKLRDDERTVLAETSFSWTLEKPYRFSIEADGDEIVARVGGAQLRAKDDATPFADGGIGLVIAEGAASTDLVEVTPLQ